MIKEVWLSAIEDLKHSLTKIHGEYSSNSRQTQCRQIYPFQSFDRTQTSHHGRWSPA